MTYPSKLIGAKLPPLTAQMICGDVLDNVTATGADQAGARLCTADHIIVTTTAASTGIRLPAAESGAELTVKNLGANALLVYPSTGGAINALAANAGFTVAAGGQARLLGRNGLNWVTY
jgi:hypothetical protein